MSKLVLLGVMVEPDLKSDLKKIAEKDKRNISGLVNLVLTDFRDSQLGTTKPIGEGITVFTTGNIKKDKKMLAVIERLPKSPAIKNPILKKEETKRVNLKDEFEKLD